MMVFFDPARDPLGSGWNKIQSEIAVGSGGMAGKGYLKGTQNVLGFLPRTVAPTDFIFSVIAEETGFIGSVLLLSLYAMLVWGGLRAALRARDKFGRLLAVGVVVLMFVHLFVNMAMTIGLMPVTGLPLPLISYGGSFMVCTMVGLGLVQSVYVRRVRR
jgi:rod shape determining protein RodA